MFHRSLDISKDFLKPMAKENDFMSLVEFHRSKFRRALKVERCYEIEKRHKYGVVRILG